MPVVELNIENSTISDTYVESKYPSNNFHTNTNLYFGNSATGVTDAQSMIKFDLGLIPNDAVVNSATLRIANSNNVVANVSLHEITSHWDSKVVVWDNKPTYNPTPEVVFTKTGMVNERNTVDVKNVVQGWINGRDNNGLLIRGEDGSTYTLLPTFFSAEVAGTNVAVYRPVLTIDYSIPTEDKKQVEIINKEFADNIGTGGVPQLSAVVKLPASIQRGDVSVITIGVVTGVTVTLPPNYTIVIDSPESLGSSGYRRVVVAYSRLEGNEKTVEIGYSASSGSFINSFIYRNVKEVISTGLVKTVSAASISPNSFSGIPENSLLQVDLFAWAANSTVSPKMGFIMSNQKFNTNQLITNYFAHRYSYRQTSYAESELIFQWGTTSHKSAHMLAIVPTTNEPPKIDGLDGYLGVQDAPLKKQYTVTDTEGDAVVITEKVNGVPLATKNVVGTHTVDLTSIWDSLPLGKHTVTISASDDYDPSRSTVRRWTFLKTLPMDAKTPEVVSGVGDLVPKFEALKTSLLEKVGGDPLDTFEDVIKDMPFRKWAWGVIRNDRDNPLKVTGLDFKPSLVSSHIVYGGSHRTALYDARISEAMSFVDNLTNAIDGVKYYVRDGEFSLNMSISTSNYENYWFAIE